MLLTIHAQASRKHSMREHIMRHQHGLWNGIWSVMIIETTYIIYGKESGGISGVTTTKKRSVQVWWEFLLSYSEIIKNLDQLRENHPKSKTVHKEKSNAKICADMKDRHFFRNALRLCAQPVDLDSHDNNLLINIYSGEIAHDNCNVKNWIIIRSKQLIYLVESFPDEFYVTVQQKAVTMEVKGKKKGSSAGNDLFNTKILICTWR